MKAYLAFTRKEFCETVRTYKLLILGAVFLLLGLMNPITAKVTPDLLKSLMPSGIEIHIGEPTALDSWAQFYKNVPQMGLIVLVIVYSGMMANEFSRGTLINMLTKGLSRSVVILSKFTAAAAVWTGGYALCFGVSYAYTAYFWRDSGIRTADIFFGAFCLWLFGVLLLAAVMLGGVMFKSSYGSLLFAGGVVVLQFVIGIFPKMQDFNPLTLASNNMALLTKSVSASDFVGPIAVGSGAAAGMVALAAVLFRKKQF